MNRSVTNLSLNSARPLAGAMFIDSAARRAATMGSGTLVTTRTVYGSTTVTSGPKDGGNVSLPSVLSFEVTTRSIVNFTDSPVNSSPLWNFTPLRSLNSHVVGLTLRHDVASSGLSSMLLGSRMSSVSQMLTRIEPVSTERNWCGSIVSGLDGSAIVNAGLRPPCARARPVRSATTPPTPISPARFSASRRFSTRRSFHEARRIPSGR
jgi:hypothetical protein